MLLANALMLKALFLKQKKTQFSLLRINSENYRFKGYILDLTVHISKLIVINMNINFPDNLETESKMFMLIFYCDVVF